jgi:hypothetical protein
MSLYTEHEACTKERTGAVAVRAALESVGRGDDGNRQAEMANPTKCRDSLQARSRMLSIERETTA